MSIAIYKKKYVTYYAIGGKKTHDCRIPGCRKRMDWDRSKITSHFKKYHPGVKLRSYYERYISKARVNDMIIPVLFFSKVYAHTH